MKKLFINGILLTTILFVLAIALYSCQKNVSPNNQVSAAGKQAVALYLNDDPSLFFTKVLVDIRYVEVKVDTSNSNIDPNYEEDENSDDDHSSSDNYGQWDTLTIIPGVYDLLQLRNGVDTLLANGFVWQGRITKVRFTLGTNNAVYIDSTHFYPINICDNSPYAYVDVELNSLDTTHEGHMELHIDFDVAKSIQMEGLSFCIRPELRAYSQNSTGAIEGKVFPKEAKPVVKVCRGSDTLYATPFENGEYKVTGIKEGAYTVVYHTALPYFDTTIYNVPIHPGLETKMPDVHLRR
jgi:Domain of unknown function (DUF4382)